MSFWRRIFGPRSKYDRRLPYTYEARVTVSGVDGMSENYQADTLCALLERLAAEHLQRQGFTIVARQHRTRFGEIDLIACNGKTLAFCEVKTRRSASGIWDALDARKQRQVRRMAAAYLADKVVVLTKNPCTVDEIVSVNLPAPRDQIATKTLPEFVQMRAHVFTRIKAFA